MGGKESLVLHVVLVCCLVFHSFGLLGENEILSQRIGTCWNLPQSHLTPANLNRAPGCYSGGHDTEE